MNCRAIVKVEKSDRKWGTRTEVQELQSYPRNPGSTQGSTRAYLTDATPVKPSVLAGEYEWGIFLHVVKKRCLIYGVNSTASSRCIKNSQG